MWFFGAHASSTILLAQSRLPSSSQAKLLLVVLAIVMVTFLGLILLTILRYLLRRWSSSTGASRSRRARAGSGARELSPWETAGRRASPAILDDEDDPNEETSP